MGNSSPPITHAVPDASLVAKWYTSSEFGWEHARLFRASFVAGPLRLSAPAHMKVEVIRLLQLGVRDKRYTVDEGMALMGAFTALPLVYIPNDTLFEDAFRLASTYFMALYDALYLALAQALAVPFVTADRRFLNLAQPRGISAVAWFEDVSPVS